MELEEMKILWERMSTELEQQKQLTDSIIIKMTKANYKTKINKVFISETAGAVVAFAQVTYLVLHFHKLDLWYVQACGILAITILVVLPVLSLRAIAKLRSLNITGNNFSESLAAYSKGRLAFASIQKLSFILGAVLMLAILPVMGQILTGKDLFTHNRLWLWYAVGFIPFYFFASWVFKHYMKMTDDAGKILKELQA